MSDRTDPRPDDSDLSPVDPALAELTEQITRRLQAGERVLAEDYMARYPAWAEPIRRLFPAIRAFVRLGQSTGRGPVDPGATEAKSPDPQARTRGDRT